MKKFIFIFAILALVVSANAQKKGNMITVTATEADTSNGAETDYIYIPYVGGFTDVFDLSIGILCTQTGGTSDGKITIEKLATGTTYVPMNTTTDTDLICANDTATITNGAKFLFRLKTYSNKYRIKIVGTSGDSTLLSTQYVYK